MYEVKKKLNNFIGNEKYSVFNLLLLISFFAFISLITTFKFFQDDDIFWHLATGRYIVQSGHIPSADVFGFVTYGTKWIPFEWGWDVMTYLIYSIGGFYLLSVFRTILIVSVFLFILNLLRKQNLSFSSIIAFSVLLIFGILTRLSVRPQLATFFFSVLLIYILYNNKYFYTGKKSVMYIAPVLFLLWANMHMGVLLGILIFAIYLISELINFFLLPKENKTNDIKCKIKFLLIAFLLSLFVLLLNPNFIDTYIYTFKHTQMDLLEQINEWKSPFSPSVITNYNVIIYIFFLITGIITIYYSIRKKDFFPALIYISVGIYSIQAIRFISDFMLIIFVPWMIALGFLIDKPVPNKIFKSIYLKCLVTALLIFLIINIYDNTVYKKYLGNYFRETGFGINEKFFPKAMFDFINKENINNIGQRPFNNLRIGGYFIWNYQESKNFIDSRNLNDSVYSLYKNIESKKYGFEYLLEKLDIDYMIFSIPYLTISASEIEHNIISYLSEEKTNWKLVYWDDRSFLFVKNIPKFRDIISNFEYKYVSSYNFIFRKKYLDDKYLSERLQVTAELRRKLLDDPNGVIINNIAENLKKIY